MSAASALSVGLLILAASSDQATPHDVPVATAPRPAAPDPLPGLDEAAVEVPPAPQTLTVQRKTLVQGQTLQVVLGQRALFMLDDKGWPVLLKVEDGQLAAAHPDGAVAETFAPPPRGQFAVALDGSAEVRATVLKVWNETDRALDYGAIALVLARDKVTPTPAPVCAVPARGLRTETWPRPIVAVGLGRFKETAKAKPCDLAG